MSRRSPSVTVIDVAREAGVSKSSAARVLSGHGSASAETQRRVTEAAERLGYRPNALARAMVSGTSNTIAAVIPDVANAFFSATLRGLTDAARAAGFEVIVSNTDNDADVEARSLEVLAEKRADGFIIAPVFQDAPEAILRLFEDGTPVVLLDRRMPALADVPLVSADHIGASRLAVEHLLELGHRRIAIVTEAPDRLDSLADLPSDADVSRLRPSTQRLLGYAQALIEHGLELDQSLVLESDYEAGSAQAAVRRALDAGLGFTGLYCTDAIVTLGAFRAVVDSGLTVPDDLSFIGFDDQDWTMLVRPSITVIDQPRHELGSTAATRLLAQLRDIDPDERDLRLPARLIPRESTAPPR
ncbi:LacI family DNA-binding transcriptional regulator [Aeromicrobium sp. YIM 150415]|uniref:LacI family DNA-binding transcriptional regulator n=1 Tax=Aeromicrobium sp. YIM 150415 TaxID=2803912 RepID=UPI001965FF08|nr:LacI family DNA-binding transcriptional regulator [Aeromicrobium sp. YIM 150415]MBM9462290.1 LacI family DNA-binding transcriptional regulator [Aeromicrobium sp. YIM 150415]